jgi:hypothetical protein
VAVEGDTAVVGAPFDDLPWGRDAGSAYVFLRSGTVWGLQAKVTAPDGKKGDRLGHSVDIDGNATPSSSWTP